jgi:putative phage-type endonuclease
MRGNVEVYENEKHWLKGRMEGIGGSEAAAICGLSKFETPLSLWALKKGMIEPAPRSLRFRVGHHLETLIHDELTENWNKSLFDLGDYTLIWSEEYPLLFATLDRVGKTDATPYKSSGLKAALKASDELVEMKTVSVYMAKDWADGPPDYIQVQAQHQMMVTGATNCVVAALHGFDDLELYDIEAHSGVQEGLLAAELGFLNSLELDQAPTADGAERTRTALKAMFPKPTKEAIELNPDHLGLLVEQKIEAESRIKEAEFDKREAENQIIQMMGEYEAAIIPGYGRFTYKSQVREEHMTNRSEFRVLRYRKEKVE